MKATKIIQLLVIALAITMVGTGCRKKQAGVTPIRNRDTILRDPGIGGTYDPNLNPIGSESPFDKPQSTKFSNPDDFNQDRSALAANTVHFEYDSSVVKSSERGNVEAVANYLKSNTSVGLLVEGHCDERGTEDYNNSLGERRATALRAALLDLGVNADHVVTRSYGEYKPVATGQDESAYSQNRRGEFVVLMPK
ncbi:MAG: OmpA family protein [Verrucomicrobiota bacterium]